ncbi:MarR family transcriptional regulator [Tenacibaculum discolor]|uniref:HTH-type transcriptional regulator SarZ n=1 Tax=Tenacibaculum discolor TaxID=361581 RepID=A0A2G1BYB0_9FLAO|nr:MarR family transcriptional regulator [Tenacibaculum discolor]MDP2541300.1 MarR family transcriptional regulator [Tenacibaculum discolor]PHN98996.1 MarR family transcriptional regulator [Tenacibaculum discolor]PHO01029.1 MarR family transcriptional regulator [Rhodobacteraceae bacterium 4F10]
MSEQLKLTNQVCFPVYTLAKEVISLYRPILKELDLTYPQYLVMLVLWEEGGQNVSEIGAKLNLDSGTLTPLLKRLEHKKLIERKRETTDERVVKINLTELGKNIQEKAECVPGQIMTSLNISVDKLTELKNIIEHILNQINKNNETNL